MKRCKKHNQDYMDFLDECPICAGERNDNPYLNRPDITTAKKEIKRVVIERVR